MRKLLIPFTAAVALFFAPLSLKSSEHHTIAGMWVLDTASAPQISGQHVTAGTLNINYTHKNISMAETFTYPHGDKTVTENWKIDHRYHPVLGQGAGQTEAAWHHMTLTAEHEENGAHRTIRLAMSPDHNTLTETTRKYDGSTQILVWKRS